MKTDPIEQLRRQLAEAARTGHVRSDAARGHLDSHIGLNWRPAPGESRSDGRLTVDKE